MSLPAEGTEADRMILAPLDGSAASELALAPALRLAAALGTGVTLLRVAADATLVPEAEAYLTALAGRAGVRSRTETRAGKAAATIAAAASAPGVVLVVLTTSGEGGEPNHLGGVAERLSRTLSAPALFVPAGYAADPPLGGPVLVALHGSAASEAAIEPAVAIAQALGTRITLVQVAPWAEGLFANYLGLPPPNADAEIELGSNTYLSSIAERLSDRLPADYQTLRGRAADMLVEYAASTGGWLVLASHAHHGPHIWGLGSTTDKVLRASSSPVLIIRVGENGAELEHPAGAAVAPEAPGE